METGDTTNKYMYYEKIFKSRILFLFFLIVYSNHFLGGVFDICLLVYICNFTYGKLRRYSQK